MSWLYSRPVVRHARLNSGDAKRHWRCRAWHDVTWRA